MNEHTLLVRAVIPDLNANARDREKLLRFHAEAADRRRQRRRTRARAAWQAVACFVTRNTAGWPGCPQLETGGR